MGSGIHDVLLGITIITLTYLIMIKIISKHLQKKVAFIVTLRHATRDQATHFQGLDVVFSWNEETEKKKGKKGNRCSFNIFGRHRYTWSQQLRRIECLSTDIKLSKAWGWCITFPKHSRMSQLKSGIVVKKTEEVDREKKKKKMKPGAEHPLRHS